MISRENLENNIIKLNNNISLNSESTNTTVLVDYLLSHYLVFTDVENIDIDYSDQEILCNKIKDRLNIDIKIEDIVISTVHTEMFFDRFPLKTTVFTAS